ncbi:MAG: PAS domain-containing protein [Clostridia bacterium]|nr:PAS domain-containing protein [Clostridia bacterium]
MGGKDMISDVAVIIFAVALIVMAVFVVWNLRRRNFGLLNRLYLGMAGAYAVWLSALIGMRIAGPDREGMLFCLDALTNGAGAFLPAICLGIALTFVRGWERMPKKGYLLFVMPLITNVVVWTNPLHHLQYKTFSIIKSKLVFGPYAIVSGIFSYFCLMTGIILMIDFVRKNRSKLYIKQCALFVAGGVVPLVVSIISTLGQNSSITTTPLSFTFTIALNGIAIYRLHFLDIKPLAVQKIMERISDGYLVLSDNELIISYNEPFKKNFVEKYKLEVNKYLSDCLKVDNQVEKTFLYNLANAVESCRESLSVITYEQADMIMLPQNNSRKNYYIVEVTALTQEDNLTGFAVLFKDVTQLKQSMQQLQSKQQRMMEQERLAFLGQMIGGLAHNLKTPIMSISGCVVAMDDLVEEYRESLDDPEVEKEDYEEICNDMKKWLEKIQESTGYMSDIITAIKGQAVVSTSETTQDQTFTVDELEKRCRLLMRHELQSSGCALVTNYLLDGEITIHGDINNMVQAVNNLLSNAIYAQQEVGGGNIILQVRQENDMLRIEVADHGKGVQPEIGDKLFKRMVTSKGAMGNGLGLYITYASIRGKFGGDMSYEDNQGNGAVFVISIPMEIVDITGTTQEGGLT